MKRILSLGALALSLSLAVATSIAYAQGYSLAGTVQKAITLTAAALAPSTHVDYIRSAVTLTPATTATATNGVNAMRGEMDLTAGKTFGTGGPDFFSGVYGRVNFNSAVVNIGSGDLAAVIGKFDLGTATLTSGHIAPLQSNIVNVPANPSAMVNGIYVESVSGNLINAVMQSIVNSTYFMDVSTNGNNSSMSTTCTPGSVTGATGGLHVLVQGTSKWIPLAATCS